MASQEGEKRHGPTTNQQNDDASPHSEHSTHIRNSSEVKKNSKYGGRGSWRSRTYGGPRGHRDNEAGRIGQMASQGEKEVERVERNGHRGDRGNGTGKGGQGAPKRKKDLGRAEWARKPVDRRARNNEQSAKRLKKDPEGQDLPVYATKFSKEEIEAQEKKPKRRVAVMLGYSGTGYKGMQLNHHERTIEGDLFKAFVDAGAISKANADDPKKSSLVRCARTDKGVHAAGNVISLKLIVEDPDIIAKINERLSPQIRVWGIERTNGSFSCYQHCDSRCYQYLIPSHCFIPPHPKSFLAKQMVELAEEANDLEGYRARQKEVENLWSKFEEKYIRPVIEEIDPSIRDEVFKALYEHERKYGAVTLANAIEDGEKVNGDVPDRQEVTSVEEVVNVMDSKDRPDSATNTSLDLSIETSNADTRKAPEEDPRDLTPVEVGLRLLKAAYIKAKNTYRIDTDRVARIRSHTSRYIGTHRFHNYTIDKTITDPSSMRIIKAFSVDDQPIVVNGIEWLSFKIWGQSFMLHQIRKMISMIALLVRCGCHEGRIQDTYMKDRISIPKAPGLGLLLERPVFEVYNEKLEGFGYNRIDFSKYEKEMEEFKQREIYKRIFREEETDHPFHSFFTGLDNTQSSQLLYLSSEGLEATKKKFEKDKLTEAAAKTDMEEVSGQEEGVAINEGG